VLLVLLVLVGGGYLVTTHGATSLEITVWKQYGMNSHPTTVRIFDKTITNPQLVRAVQAQINGAPVGPQSFCSVGPPSYVYQFRFATVGFPTQGYEGNSLCGGWSITMFGIPLSLLVPVDVYVDEARLDGVELLSALQQKTGMPLPPNLS
jgi:hypothetical protein